MNTAEPVVAPATTCGRKHLISTGPPSHTTVIGGTIDVAPVPGEELLIEMLAVVTAEYPNSTVPPGITGIAPVKADTFATVSRSP
jgi:hypothetical protein